MPCAADSPTQGLRGLIRRVAWLRCRRLVIELVKMAVFGSFDDGKRAAGRACPGATRRPPPTQNERVCTQPPAFRTLTFEPGEPPARSVRLPGSLGADQTELGHT